MNEDVMFTQLGNFGLFIPLEAIKAGCIFDGPLFSVGWRHDEMSGN